MKGDQFEGTLATGWMATATTKMTTKWLPAIAAGVWNVDISQGYSFVLTVTGSKASFEGGSYGTWSDIEVDLDQAGLNLWKGFSMTEISGIKVKTANCGVTIYTVWFLGILWEQLIIDTGVPKSLSCTDVTWFAWAPNLWFWLLNKVETYIAGKSASNFLCTTRGGCLNLNTMSHIFSLLSLDEFRIRSSGWLCENKWCPVWPRQPSKLRGTLASVLAEQMEGRGWILQARRQSYTSMWCSEWFFGGIFILLNFPKITRLHGWWWWVMIRNLTWLFDCSFFWWLCLVSIGSSDDDFSEL